MTMVQVAKQIQADRETVFSAFSDLQNLENVIDGIVKLEMLTDGPMGLETRWRETRVMFNREATEEMWVTAFEPPSGYTVEAESHGSHYTSVFVFEAKDGGTEVTMTFTAKPLTFFAKIMGFLMGPMMRKSIIKCLGQDMDDLKRHIENHA